ncbi:MAG: gamma-glutamyl-gamma-aminobutyrate hydrolase family protein [Holophaga sp.]
MSSLLVTCQNKSAVARTYIPAVRMAGWTGEILVASPSAPAPPLEEAAGLLLTGGYDIHPRRWDELEPLHPTAEPDEPRDELEIPLIREAWERGLPILGICRGVQVLNVALGGSLIQDIPDHCGLAHGVHMRGNVEEADEAHAVAVAPGSRLAALMGSLMATVNSRHHQAVLRVAPCLQPVAWYRDPDRDLELVEGVEAPDPGRFVVGVQWHPENLVAMGNGTGSAARGIFRGFVKALGGR